MKGWNKKDNIVKLHFDFNSAAVTTFAAMLKKMNLSSATLFPGLDGFARSLGEQNICYTTGNLPKSGTGSWERVINFGGLHKFSVLEQNAERFDAFDANHLLIWGRKSPQWPSGNGSQWAWIAVVGGILAVGVGSYSLLRSFWKTGTI
jgi:hypothetical protein